jgi:hypothetical protein
MLKAKYKLFLFYICGAFTKLKELKKYSMANRFKQIKMILSLEKVSMLLKSCLHKMM